MHKLKEHWNIMIWKESREVAIIIRVSSHLVTECNQKTKPHIIPLALQCCSDTMKVRAFINHLQEYEVWISTQLWKLKFLTTLKHTCLICRWTRVTTHTKKTKIHPNILPWKAKQHLNNKQHWFTNRYNWLLQTEKR